ncbi:MAG TPA: FAD-dependent oxidoreductase [Hyphomicrobiales bacterium]|nr:FAD-dependent oxidoreductase [Hyphomicrobiales bacterium]
MTESTAAAGSVATTCCIAGGGPAGMMLGYLLARAGVDATVLEKHGDFLRDFRGDTVHPATMELMWELGLLDEFLKRPHHEEPRIGAQIGPTVFGFADFSHLPTHCKFIALMPQWHFLDFLAEQGRKLPSFHLMMQADATGLIAENGRIVGVHAMTPDGPVDLRAALVVGADGRHSTVRGAAGLAVEDLGAPMDVLWFRVSREDTDPPQTLGRVDRGHMMIMLDRGDYWQCAFVIPKGDIDAVRARGLDAFRAEVAAVAPPLADRTGEIASWDDVKLLTVAVDRLTQWWKPGLLCIGDAAHAMSPIGGVGINLAIQDAVAAANILAAPLKAGTVTDADLAAVQRRRMLPMRLTQAAQLFVQNNVINRVLASRKPIKPPLVLRLIDRVPWLQRIPARLVGIGIRPEHVRQPAAPVAPSAAAVTAGA